MGKDPVYPSDLAYQKMARKISGDMPKISTAQPPQGRAGLHTLSRWPEGGGSGQSIRSQLVTPTELEATSVAQTVAAAKDAAITDHTETNYTNRNLTP